MGVYYSSKMRLVEKALSLWRVYGELYRRLIPDYESAIALKRSKHLPLHKVPDSIIRELPKISLLEKETEEEAKEYLIDLTEQSIKYTIWAVEDLKYNRAWNGMRASLIDARYANNRTNPKSPFGVDPSSVRTNTKKRRHSGKLDSD